MWQQWINALLGLWVIAVPFIGMSQNALMWTLAITGIVIAVLGAWGAIETTPERQMQRAQHQT